MVRTHSKNMTVTAELAVLLTVILLRDFMGHFVNNKKTEQWGLLNG